MNQLSDQILAKRMLEMHDRGYSFALFFRRSAKNYLLVLSCFGSGLIAFGLLQLWIPFNLILGLSAGCLLRDIGWFRAISKTWPFSLKVTDWDKVRRLAEETPTA